VPNALIPYIKSVFQDIPRPIGFILAKLPYGIRPGIGRAYTQYQQRIESFDRMDIDQQQAFVLSRLRRLISEAMKVPFYRSLYTSHGLVPEDIRTFSDIAQIPMVTKETLRETPLDGRSRKIDGCYMANTGGSSGSPLEFYITPGLIPIEWAHMHTIWGKLGYRQSMLKLSLSGRSLGEQPVAYDGLRHQYSINVYKSFSVILPALREVVNKMNVCYLHGYPSALSEFAENCERYAPDVVERLKVSLRGAFLGSEYPAPKYREQIETVFDVPTISWYGHTERAVLAWEKYEKFVYHPFHTYGYCEVVPNEDTGGWKLVGTSYENFASPFIRYDTGDDVEPVEVREGLLISFRIRFGRSGEFVLDCHGTRIPLTALIFGRHHRLFDLARFIQVRQAEAGHMTVIVTPRESLPPGFACDELFDSRGLDMTIRFEIVDSPILSSSGKVMLRVQ